MRLAFVVVALCLSASLATAPVAQVSRPMLHLVSQTAGLSARDAGRRGGEAAGAAILCEQLKVTGKVAELRGHYQGEDLAEFDAEASKIMQAWEQVKGCVNGQDPNQCKIAQQTSCVLALREVGPQGKIVPGLVELK
jgi:hypothetical protein